MLLLVGDTHESGDKHERHRSVTGLYKLNGLLHWNVGCEGNSQPN